MLVPELSPFLILLELRMVRGGGDNWSTGCAKYQSNRHHQQTNIQLFTGHMPRVATLGKLFTHMPPSASSIIWYQLMAGDTVWYGIVEFNVPLNTV